MFRKIINSIIIFFTIKRPVIPIMLDNKLEEILPINNTTQEKQMSYFHRENYLVAEFDDSGIKRNTANMIIIEIETKDGGEVFPDDVDNLPGRKELIENIIRKSNERIYQISLKNNNKNNS